MTTRSRRFRLLLPAIWGFGCLLGFQVPGDEYFLFAVGSIAGVWAGLLFAGDVQNVIVPVLAAGGLLMFGIGFVIDLLRGSLAVWLPTWIAFAALMYHVSLSGFESTAAAIAKNGSLLAHVVCASQLGVYCATLITLLAAAIRRYGALLSEDLARHKP